VRVRYEKLRGEVKDRRVDPCCLRIHQEEIYLLGHCHPRGQLRIFLVDRIQDVMPLEEAFPTPPEFFAVDLLDASLNIDLGELGSVVVRFCERCRLPHCWTESREGLPGLPGRTTTTPSPKGRPRRSGFSPVAANGGWS